MIFFCIILVNYNCLSITDLITHRVAGLQSLLQQWIITLT